ncbi:MAG: hypothetical protein EA382_14510, partial [Spirochaetaceae bacterium]
HRSPLAVAALAIGLYVCAPAAAFGPREAVDAGSVSLMEVAMLSDYVDQEIRVGGTIGAYGSMPRVWLGLMTGDPATPNGDRPATPGQPPEAAPPLLRFTESVLFELVGEGAQPLWELQGSRVTVTGILRQTAVGPGFPARLEVIDYQLEKR